MQFLRFFQKTNSNGKIMKLLALISLLTSSKRYIMEVDLEYPKKVRELHNDHPLATEKIEIKREFVFDNQLKCVDLYNILYS